MPRPTTASRPIIADIDGLNPILTGNPPDFLTGTPRVSDQGERTQVGTPVRTPGKGDRSKSGPTPKRRSRISREVPDRARWENALERKAVYDAVQATRKEVLAIGERAGLSGLMKRGSSTAKECSIKDAEFHSDCGNAA